MYSTLAALALLAVGCDQPLGIGDACQVESDCAADLQCFAGTCTPHCASPFSCGDGFDCRLGHCVEVRSDVGSACKRELDCGPSQSCLLGEGDGDGDGKLDATCQPDRPGAGTGASCEVDNDCRDQLCAFSTCTALCLRNEDCPGSSCVKIFVADDLSFMGCLESALLTPEARDRAPYPPPRAVEGQPAARTRMYTQPTKTIGLAPGSGVCLWRQRSPAGRLTGRNGAERSGALLSAMQ